MRIIGYVFPEPPENVLQGACIGGWPLGDQQDESWKGPVLQGKSMFDPVPAAVPRALVGWLPYVCQAPSIGPMAVQGGLVSMVPVGAAPAVSPLIDSAQRFLASGLPLDSTGSFYPADTVLTCNEETERDYVLAAESLVDSVALARTPRAEVINSGLLKTLTAPVMPDFFGQKVYPGPISYPNFTLSGLTLDNLSVPIPNARVLVRETSRMRVSGAEEVMAAVISNGSGAFSIPARNTAYQLTAYAAGSPDKAGISKDSVTPVSQTNIYLYDPTVPVTGGSGGSGVSRGRITNA